MTTAHRGWSRLAVGLGLVALAGADLRAVAAVHDELLTNPSDLLALVAFGAAILLGECLALSPPGLRGSAPISLAAAFGLCFVVQMPARNPLSYGTATVVATAGTAMAVGIALRRASGRTISPLEGIGRFCAVVVVAILYRWAHLGQSDETAAPFEHLDPWQAALLLLVICAAGLAVDLVLTATVHTGISLTGLRRHVVDEVRTSAPLSTAVAFTGVLITFGAPPLGIAALPLFLAPLVLTQFAFRRYLTVRVTYLQSIRTLSRLTDLAGYTASGHSERVAALAVATGRQLGLSERVLLDLEYAALLHDIGQVALLHPIPGGATVLAAPSDQRRIEADTVAIVRESGVLEEVATILEHQTTPYRRVREFGEQIPVASRIIKVANAYEDLTAGARGPRARDSAFERIYLGLGYEYDPRVVDALENALAGARPGGGAGPAR